MHTVHVYSYVVRGTLLVVEMNRLLMCGAMQ
jgi:hypothetical protein